jgi:hypothetical protein
MVKARYQPGQFLYHRTTIMALTLRLQSRYVFERLGGGVYIDEP